MNIINTVLIYISLGLTVISLIDYIAKNYKVFWKVQVNNNG